MYEGQTRRMCFIFLPQAPYVHIYNQCYAKYIHTYILTWGEWYFIPTTHLVNDMLDAQPSNFWFSFLINERFSEDMSDNSQSWIINK